MDAKEVAITHGLDGTLVEPDWPPLTIEEVRGLLRFYPAQGKSTRLLTVSPRPFSAAGLVEADGARIFVKRHHGAVRDVEGLQEEHRFMAHLGAAGIPVPRVLVTSARDTAIRIGDWTYEIHEPAPGLDVYSDAISWTPFRSPKHAFAAGQALARLHLASRGYDAPPRKKRHLVAGFTIFASPHPGQALDRYIGARPALQEYLQNRHCQQEALVLLAPFHAEILPLLPALPPLWTHNDWHASNLMWSNGGEDARVAGVIDFGLADRTCAVHDLAHAIERSIIDWLALVNHPAHPEKVAVHYDHLFAMLNGYESIRPLSPRESLALGPMLALCHAEFALSETDYFLGVLHSGQKAWYACEGYLVLHARWFRGPGQNLLDVLHTWAATRKQVIPEVHAR